MASESSSAVLELNDADGEDTEAPSVTDEAREGAPLIMEHGYDIAVKVDAPLKQLSTLETYVTYRVRCVCARWPSPPYVRRRYNHFKVLHKRLSMSHGLVAAPPLPPLHSARQQLDRYSPGFVAIRTLALNAFLDLVAKHPILTHSEDFRLFLTTPDEELDKIFKSENSALNLWGLSSALYGNSSESKPANGARVKDPEFTAASDYLQSLQQKLTTLCTLTTKLYKGSTALGTELMGMKRTCDAWSCSERWHLSRAVVAGGAGARAAAAALQRPRPPLRARATLPLLAAYAHAHHHKIRQRDQIHAAHVAGNNSDELHNRLSQATEALRSELSDWTPKTHAEIKTILMEIADRQVTTLTQVLMGWEHALKLSTEANVDELFKTVSKTAVQNLSPSKCKSDITPTETDRDFDDIDNLSDLDVQELRQDKELDLKIDASDVKIDSTESTSDNIVKIDHSDVKIDSTESTSDNIVKIDSSDVKIDSTESTSDNIVKIDSSDVKIDSTESASDNNVQIDSVKIDSIESDNVDLSDQASDVFDKIASEVKRENGVSIESTRVSKELSESIQKSEKVISDPLQSFSEVDLTS